MFICLIFAGLVLFGEILSLVVKLSRRRRQPFRGLLIHDPGTILLNGQPEDRLGFLMRRRMVPWKFPNTYGIRNCRTMHWHKGLGLC